jgi:hypothetical protein
VRPLATENSRDACRIGDSITSSETIEWPHHNQVDVHEFSENQAVKLAAFSNKSPNNIAGCDALMIVGYSTWYSRSRR